jgi:hypothetical protein
MNTPQRQVKLRHELKKISIESIENNRTTQ